MKRYLAGLALLAVVAAGTDAEAEAVSIARQERDCPPKGPLGELLPQPVSIVPADGTLDAADCRIAVKTAQVPGAPAETADESYVLDVAPTGVSITAPDVRGERWARVTLEQLKRLSGGRIPCCHIVDWPRYPWRGLMHDSGRNFLEVEHVKALIDWLSSYKMNLFHWHLTEYYGWRLESRRYPELQSDKAFYLRGNHFYTQEEFKDVVAYATARGVTVMPEFDVPGHALAFRRAFGYRTMRDEGVREKLCDLIDELCSLVPAEAMPFIHLGSDEARLPEEKVPVGWMQPLVDRVHAAGRTVVGWDPGELKGVKMSGPAVAMRWGGNDAAATTLPASFDGGGYYVDTMEPFELPCAATYRKTCDWSEAKSAKTGLITCLWHDEYQGEGRGYETLRNQFALPAIAMLSDTFWRGRDRDEKGFYRRAPLAGDPRLEPLRELERRLIAHRDRLHADSPHPFSFLRQTDLRWRITDTNGTLVAKDVAQATLFLWQIASSGVEGAGMDKGAIGGNFLTNRSGCVVCETWIRSPVERRVGAWIGFTAYDRDHGRAYSGRTARLGEWNNQGATVELNGKPVPPPRWKKPGQEPGGDVRDLLYVHEIDEVPYEDEEYYMRPPTPITLRAGWNHVKLTIPKDHAGGHNPWVGTFIPLLGTTEHPREVPDLEYRSSSPN